MTQSEDHEEKVGDGAAEAWMARADELAEWASATLVNRTDVHGGQFVTSSGEINRLTWRDGLTHDDLVRHFGAERTGDVIGLHATAPDETCRWVGIDIDAHDGQGASREGNFRLARAVRRRAQHAGLDVRLIDSSGGKGGYHLWSVFAGPIPMADARRLALWLVRDWDAFGLARRPDLFPGNDHLTGKRCGNWLRLIGRHHKRPCWAAVWSPKRQIWRTGDEAIDALLTLRGKPVNVSAIVPADFVEERPKKRARPRLNSPDRVIPVAAEGRSTSPTAANSARPISTSPKRHGCAGDGPRDLRLARAALGYYPNDDFDYDDWIEVGMALRNLEDEAAAFALWDAWSERSGKYDAELTAAKWEGLRPAGEGGGIGLGTLYRRAMDAGWPGPAFEIFDDDRGLRRITHRSRRRGIVVVPVAPSRRPTPESNRPPTGPVAHNVGNTSCNPGSDHGPGASCPAPPKA